ncbi:uncharacterized protein BDR25DRAFT_79813 [Lindgomyces ingoldianus]|uniref:Uncharacterized protein n=1 Tax=Lindgomyces ingoldianus TaxID=673940 RepID=A0ACB6QGZ2_9PLEO|nr:uncharacterized protein BDR25DRAFT_79813 [Lindgomyces ingoldianus]KAF2466155.1 hypothetical protein BDR25DRAFT_79813 [Lindgomyces ingoldianus]
MKFATTIAAAILAFTSSTVAAPVSGPYITPETISIHHGYNGQIEFNVRRGKIQRQQSGNDDISTLMTFSFPQAADGKTCEFNFELNDGTFSVTPDVAQLDAFHSSQYATASSPGWGPPSNYRDVQLGRLEVSKWGGLAQQKWGSFSFPCPSGKKGFEVAPTGDAMTIEWDSPSDGPYIRYY